MRLVSLGWLKYKLPICLIGAGSLRQTRIPENTKKKMHWAWRIFTSWFSERKTKSTAILKVYNDFDEFLESDLNHCSQYFVAEVRKVNGEHYPPRTLKAIIVSIQFI